MKNLKLLSVFLISCFIVSCSDCSKFETESYSDDTLMLEFEAKEGLSNLYSYLGEKDYSVYPLESYRLLRGKSGSPQKKVIRIDETKDGYAISYKIFTAKAIRGSQEMAVKIVEENTYKLSAEDWDKYNRLIYEKDFWTMPEMTEKHGYGGVTYFIEGRRPLAENCNKRTQHIVSGWNVTSGKFYALCSQMENLLRQYKKD